MGSFFLGAILTSLPPVSGYFSEEWGRRSFIVLGRAIFLAGAIVQAPAGSIPVMVRGRFIAGMSIGLLSAVVAFYQSELAAPSLRGTWTSMFQWGFIVVSFSFGAILTSLPPVSGYFLEEWGRRSFIVLGIAIFLAGAIVQAQAGFMSMFQWGFIVGSFIIDGCVELALQ